MAHLDPDTLPIVLWHGFAFAVFAGVLYFLTSNKSARGFRILPANLSGWIAYWFRLLEMTIVACVILACHAALSPGGEIVFATTLFLLLASVLVFWRCERLQSVYALSFLVLSALGFLCIPAIPLT